MNYNQGKNHPRFKDLTNKKFGELTLLEYVLVEEKTQNVWKWKSKCSCGIVTYTRTKDFLKENPVQSCKKCGIKRMAKSRILSDNLSLKNRLFRVYKRGAKNRKYSFNLTFEQFLFIISQNCHYCNASPIGDSFLRNGVDRLNNKMGYELKNVVPCCSICNKMKMDLDYKVFLSQISKCYKNLNK